MSRHLPRHPLRRRHQERELRELNRASRREWARQENAELAAAWHAHPVELCLLVVTRLFFAQDFGRLERHLASVAGSAQMFKAVAQRDVAEFFHQSRTAAGARGYWTRVADLQPPSSKRLVGPVIWPSLPPWVDHATLYLGMARPGIASLSAMVTVRDDAQVIANLFRSHHETLVRRDGRHERSLLAADAKAVALGQMFRDASSCDLFPKGAGQPSEAYPGAVVALYNLRRHELPDDTKWRDIERVLGLDWLDKWTDGSLVVASGLPHASDEMAGGVSVITMDADLDARSNLRRYGTVGNFFSVRYLEFMVGLTPWVALRGTLDELTNASAALRQRLQLYHPIRMRHLRRGGPKALLNDLGRSRYALLQLRSFADDPSEPFFPTVRRADVPKAPVASIDSPSKRLAIFRRRHHERHPSDESAAPPNPTLKESMVRAVRATMRYTEADLDASLERANQLLQLRIANSVRFWAVTAVTVSAAVLIVTIIALRH